MRLAAIDVGSNSLHMVIADLEPGGQLKVVDRVKEVARLGRRAFSTGRLGAPAMDLALHTLSNFRRLAEVRQVDRIRAIATSAVREARNRAEFLRRIRRSTGLRVEVISGAEEARMIFAAARYALGLDGGPHLLLDVGGGSVELVLARDREAVWMHSVPLGVWRLTERFLHDDPPSRRQVARLERHLEQVLGGPLREARRAGVARVIGTSGTVNSLIAMVCAARGDHCAKLHGAAASAVEIARLRRRLLARESAERERLPGADAKRSDLLPAAAVLADYVLAASAAGELAACSWALREGVLLELAGLAPDSRAHRAAAAGNGAGRHHGNGWGAGGVGEIRRRSVEALAARFAGSNDHGRQVARLALALFDALAQPLRLAPRSRELLEYAALLHDIGHSIDHDRHNRHSYYLIKNADLMGFEPDEIELIAQAARAHRKQAGKLDPRELAALAQPARRAMRPMAAILRIADGLDRSHLSVVKGIRVTHSPSRLTITIDSASDNDALELWTCEKRTDLLSKLLNRPVKLRSSSLATGPRTAPRTAPAGAPMHQAGAPAAASASPIPTPAG